MTKVCPFSMGGEITECEKDDCMIYIDGDCVLTKIGVSLYYMSKNLKKIAEMRDYDDLR